MRERIRARWLSVNVPHLRRAAFCLASLALTIMPFAHTGSASVSESVRLRVMTMNIFYGGDELNLRTLDFCERPLGCQRTFARTIDAIRAGDADVVALEEGEHSTRPIAEALGWFHSERTQIISRFPLIDPPGADGNYVYVEPVPGKVAAVANFHLPSDPYGPYMVRDGATLDEVIALEESARLPALVGRLPALEDLVDRGIPVFVTGDFNTPSHLDWTEAAAAARPEVRYPVAWPVSLALEDAGFLDSYREVHPDPVAFPGFTWTPGGPESVPDEVHDRIDWVLSAGDVRAVASQIVGEAGGTVVDIAVQPYPPDHRGVVSTFDLVLGAPPPYAAVEDRALQPGQVLRVRTGGCVPHGKRVVLLPAGAGPGQALASLPAGAVVEFATASLAPGAYEAALLDGGGRVLSRSRFWLHDTPARVATSRAVYRSGEPIEVSWLNAPGMRWDWLGLFTATGGSADPFAAICNATFCGSGEYLFYVYTRNTIEGSTSFDGESPANLGSWPLPAGQYEVRLLLDDGFRQLAVSAPFEVTE